jgi:hypothetical protein
MGYKRPYEEKESEYKDIFEDVYKPSEITSLNKFQDQLRKENEEFDKLLEEAWNTRDKSVIKEAKKLKKDLREALRDITNLKINPSQKIKKRSKKSRRTKKSGRSRRSKK